MSDSAIEKYGWTAVPRSLPELLKTAQVSGDAPFISASSIKLPDTPLVTSVLGYAKKELPIETFNHSMRVYYYGQAILQHLFPTWISPTFNETYLLTSLLHDIGTTPANLSSTHLSFEFSGALISHTLLSSLSAPILQLESVLESIIRHQDLGTTGFQTRIGGLIQLATIFDNMGQNEEIVNRGTIEDVTSMWPRWCWSDCFARTVRRENELKPWCHSSHLGVEEFPDGVEGNKLMKPWDGLS